MDSCIDIIKCISLNNCQLLLFHLKTFFTEMGRGVITKLSTMLEEGDLEDEGGEEDDAIEGEAEADEEQEEAEGNEYSDDSSDVDV